MTTVASILSLSLVMIICGAGARGNTLPPDCIISTPPTVSCRFRKLTAVPDGIPQNVTRVSLSHNKIRTINLPLLKLVTSVDMSSNLVETVSWVSLLRNLPALSFFYLSRNRIKSLDFDVVLSAGTELTYLDLTHNQLVTITEPQVDFRKINGIFFVHNNPFHCDCKLHWLINKLACLQACRTGQDEISCCRSCKVCYFLALEINELTCDSPAKLQTFSLWQVDGQPLECEASAINSTKACVLQTEHLVIGEGTGIAYPGNVKGNKSVTGRATSSPGPLSSHNTALFRSATLQTDTSESLAHTSDSAVHPLEYFGQGASTSKDVHRDNVVPQKETSSTGSQSASSGTLVIVCIALGILIGAVAICSVLYLARRVITYRQARTNMNGNRHVYILPPGYPAFPSNLNAIQLGQVRQPFSVSNSRSANVHDIGNHTGFTALKMIPPVPQVIPPVENNASRGKSSLLRRCGAVSTTKLTTNSDQVRPYPRPNVASSAKGAEHADYTYQHDPPHTTEDPAPDHVYEYLP
uniref:LRRCT domain-containing protein n=1 Tax=Branchiostoma floridae TaxID=7739 RepID=C3Y3L7_BRAFL|eukprot:XP_002608883.1 hypothetical protein BRAFLDRAFT_102024 [Branchiostoma floridae]